jgi:hypothetical protein
MNEISFARLLLATACPGSPALRDEGRAFLSSLRNNDFLSNLLIFIQLQVSLEELL